MPLMKERIRQRKAKEKEWTCKRDKEERFGERGDGERKRGGGSNEFNKWGEGRLDGGASPIVRGRGGSERRGFCGCHTPKRVNEGLFAR